MIEAVTKGLGSPKAKMICDGCGAEVVFTCDYESGSARRKVGREWAPNQGQAIRKAAGLGWSRVKGKDRCPICEAARKATQTPPIVIPETSMAQTAALPADNVAPIRQPSREQKREIMALLDAAYDIEAQRYRGKDTDKTVAEALGPGVLWGWVAEIREEFFGPAGGNAEMDEIEAELRAALKEVEAQIAASRERILAAQDALSLIVKEAGRVVEIEKGLMAQIKRIDAIKAAVGPRAARA